MCNLLNLLNIQLNTNRILPDQTIFLALNFCWPVPREKDKEKHQTFAGSQPRGHAEQPHQPHPGRNCRELAFLLFLLAFEMKRKQFCVHADWSNLPRWLTCWWWWSTSPSSSTCTSLALGRRGTERRWYHCQTFVNFWKWWTNYVERNANFWVSKLSHVPTYLSSNLKQW